jgi:hypothetical protein
MVSANADPEPTLPSGHPFCFQIVDRTEAFMLQEIENGFFSRRSGLTLISFSPNINPYIFQWRPRIKPLQRGAQKEEI